MKEVKRKRVSTDKNVEFVHRLHRFTQIIYFLEKFEQFIIDIINIFESLKQSIMQTINVKINKDSPTGRCLLKEV